MFEEDKGKLFIEVPDELDMEGKGLSPKVDVLLKDNGNTFGIDTMSLIDVGVTKSPRKITLLNSEITGETGKTGVKGDTGDTGFSPIVNVDHVTGQIVITTEDGSSTISFDELKGDTGDTGASGFSPIVNVNHETGEIVITTSDGDVTISFDELKGDTGDTGVKGDTGDAFTFEYFTEEQLANLKGEKGATGDTGAKCDTGEGSDEEAG